MDYSKFVKSLNRPLDGDVSPAFEKPAQVEIVVDKQGRPRQAGAADAEGRAIVEFRERAEKSLYAFAKGVMGLSRLTPTLHRDVCQFVQKVPPYRRLGLLPRDHLKTSIVSRALPIHMLIQPKGGLYLPDIEGCSTRILLSNETATNAEHFLRWIEARFESHGLLRALWPHRCWDNARRQSRKWNEKEMVVPRTEDFPEASIETIGVGGAITSRHYTALIKDDLVSIEAANSPVVMADAIEWHRASRALLDDPDRSLEFIVGTRWSAQDLYQFIIDTDPTVEVYHRAAIEDGEPIFPEMFPLDTLNRIRKELGSVLFSLLYMNSAADPELVDFVADDVRRFEIIGEKLAFTEDERDMLIRKAKTPRVRPPQDFTGMPLNRSTYDLIFGRGEYFRLKAR